MIVGMLYNESQYLHGLRRALVPPITGFPEMPLKDTPATMLAGFRVRRVQVIMFEM